MTTLDDFGVTIEKISASRVFLSFSKFLKGLMAGGEVKGDTLLAFIGLRLGWLENVKKD